MMDYNAYTSDWQTIFLKELGKVALTKRMDTKYILNSRQLLELLDQMKANYSILEIDHNRVFQYYTTYFDTPNFQFYLDHHNRRIVRMKVRMREYVDSGLKYYEIKNKLPGQETDKQRLVIHEMTETLSEAQYEMIKNKRFQHIKLEKKLINRFSRMTFAQIHSKERITIDTDINFESGDRYTSIPDIVILELKQPRFDVTSDLVRALKKMRIHPTSFSKYVMGIVSLNLHPKQNEFKPQKLKIKKLQSILN